MNLTVMEEILHILSIALFIVKECRRTSIPEDIGERSVTPFQPQVNA